MSHQRSTIRRVGVAAVLAVCLALPGVIWAGPPASNPGQPFAEVLAQIGILNDKIDDLLANGVDLRGVTQNWDKKLDSTNGDANGCNSDRFTCIFGNTAVRDNETGLVWDRSPSVALWTWFAARNLCMDKEVGGRLGFRLPSVHELSGLIDRQVITPGVPKLPPNHPFINVQGSDREAYWAAQAAGDNPALAFRVLFGTGGSGNAENKNSPSFFWCVRGGSPGPDQY